MIEALLALTLVVTLLVFAGQVLLLRKLGEVTHEQRRLREQITLVHAVALEARDRPIGLAGLQGSGSGAFQPISIEPQPVGNPALTGHRLPQPDAIISTTEVARLAKSFLKT